MKHAAFNARRPGHAFTLIELLIVIAIIAILAAMIIPITRAAGRRQTLAKARTQLTFLEVAIENYHTKLGHYPPDNPGKPWLNQLYYELLGTTNTGPTLETVDGSAELRIPGDFATIWGPNVSGFANCSTGGGDEGHTAVRFLSDLKPSQVGTPKAVDANSPFPLGAKFLVCSVPWPLPPEPALYPLGVGGLNPFRYNSSNPTNNPNSFDLWVDVIINGKTNRISNWSKEPIIVSQPW